MRTVERIIQNPLGVGNSLAPSKKEWVASAISGAVGLASSIFGGASAAKAAREAERRQRQQEAIENGNYLRRYNQDYIDTAAGQNLLRRAREAGKKYIQRAEGAAKVAGSTDAATAQAKEAAVRAEADTIAEIAAQDTARKDRIDEQHQKAQERFMAMDMARAEQKAQNITNAAQAASNAVMSIGSAVEQASASKNSLQQAGMNNSKPVQQTGSGIIDPTGVESKAVTEAAMEKHMTDKGLAFHNTEWKDPDKFDLGKG